MLKGEQTTFAVYSISLILVSGTEVSHLTGTQKIFFTILLLLLCSLSSILMFFLYFISFKKDIFCHL